MWGGLAAYGLAGDKNTGGRYASHSTWRRPVDEVVEGVQGEREEGGEEKAMVGVGAGGKDEGDARRQQRVRDGQ